MKKNKFELWNYVSVGAGLALSTSSFMLISGLFAASNFLGVAAGTILAGVFCLFIADAVAEMASMYPSAPGLRTYLKQAFGDKFSLTLIYMYLMMLILIAGAESYVFALVIQFIFPDINTLVIIIAALSFVIGINLRGIEMPKKFQMGTTLILLSGIFLIGALGLIMNLGDVSTGSLPSKALMMEGLPALPALVGMAIFLFIGFEWVTPLGISPQSYERKIPISMPIAIGINIVVYTCFVFGIGVSMEAQTIAQTSIPQVPYITQLLGTFGVYIALLLSVLALLSTFNAGLLGGARLVYALARERNMPKYCAKISYETGVPQGAIYFLGILSIISAIIVNTFKLDLLFVIVSSFIVCCIYGSLVVALPVLRKKQSERKRSYKTRFPKPLFWFLGMILPLLGIFSLFTIPELSLLSVLVTLLIVIIASILARKVVRTKNAERKKKPKGNTNLHTKP